MSSLENAYELTLTVCMSARYHSLCERWFLKLNKLVTFCNVFLGSGVVWTSFSSAPNVTAGFGMVIAFLSALDVTFGFAQKANQHRDLYRRYAQLDAAIARESLQPEEILARTRDIEADEPPIIETFRIAAYRQNLATHGQADHEPTVRPSWIQRLMLAFV
jgi:hypothetical protein